MQVLRFTLFGLLLVTLLAGLVYWSNSGSQVRLNAEVVRVRVVATSEKSAVLIAELRINNPASVPFVVREVKTVLTQQDGRTLAGDQVAQGDLDRLLAYFPADGPRYNETLKIRSRLPGKSRRDWTVAASFPAAKRTVDGRRGLAFEIEDVDGVRVTVTESR